MTRDAGKGMRPLLTRTEAMEFLNVKRWTFDQLVASGALEEIRLRPRCIRYRRDDLLTFLEAPRPQRPQAELFAERLRHAHGRKRK